MLIKASPAIVIIVLLVPIPFGAMESQSSDDDKLIIEEESVRCELFGKIHRVSASTQPLVCFALTSSWTV